MCDRALGDNSPRRKRFIESSSFYHNNECADPFAKLKIHDSTFLEEVPQRSTCPRCNRSRKYYCYSCYVAVEEVSNRLPIIKLPVQVDIIKHPKEVDGKSTSAHAAVLAPHHVKVYTYPDIPVYENEEVILIFPSKSAVPLQEWWQENVPQLRKNSKFESEKCLEDFKSDALDNSSKEPSLPFKRVVFIDSTWRQSKALYSDPRLKSLPCVLLSTYQSLFWRYYRGQKAWHLSTIEAVYYYLVDLHTLSCDDPYDGRYDDLLFFFRFMYFKIRGLYDPLKLKAYCARR